MTAKHGFVSIAEEKFAGAGGRPQLVNQVAWGSKRAKNGRLTHFASRPWKKPRTVWRDSCTVYADPAAALPGSDLRGYAAGAVGTGAANAYWCEQLARSAAVRLPLSDAPLLAGIAVLDARTVAHLAKAIRAAREAMNEAKASSILL